VGEDDTHIETIDADGVALAAIQGLNSIVNEQAETIVAEAIALGYRHIDTAYRYENETGVGRGLRTSGVSRAESI
jgi:2,5-diketo-D-gluconate reductase A